MLDFDYREIVKFDSRNISYNFEDIDPLTRQLFINEFNHIENNSIVDFQYEPNNTDPDILISPGDDAINNIAYARAAGDIWVSSFFYSQPDYYQRYVVAHEIGHTLSLGHNLTVDGVVRSDSTLFTGTPEQQFTIDNLAETMTPFDLSMVNIVFHDVE
ncbi:MAG: hypothetical protein F6K34_01195 [Okeania sp. SIO4D6]|uniref:hypothetical protein n=1 Tax=unclassified Okeania TaxID=2634635 RepID=UPI0013B6E65B|nr:MULTISPECIES: hypothetical protein [unclassified Okeania]NEP03545.1 hypothetical protein [Okeania sp. SIO4D6]NEP75714.1 hypothetical protein [Okeania sp. SIO2G5]NEP96591.1 hypothetical protein [Okeania sp. SIO2F5]